MYYIVYHIFYFFSLLPWFIIYRISDLLYFLTYYVLGYRKEVVMNNLAIAFPEKSEKERIRIAKEMYKRLIDTFLETLKALSISKEELNKRFQANYEVVNDLYESGQNVQLHGGHFFNWEYTNLAYCLNIKYPFTGVYYPLSNKIFDKIMYDLRSKFGSILIPAPTFNRQFLKIAKGRYVLTLGGDQNASNLGAAYWLPLFGKMAPFVTGLERMAVAKDTAIVMCTTYRVKRGYYKSEFSLFTTQPSTLPQGAITIGFRDYLENQIRLRPENYLWTHKRWKHQFDPNKFAEMVLEDVNKTAS